MAVAESAMDVGRAPRFLALWGDVWEFWNLLWNNRPVSDENSFVDEYREHSFGFAVISSWSFALVGTTIILIRILAPIVDPAAEVGVRYLINQQFFTFAKSGWVSNWVSLCLFWTPAFAFSVFGTKLTRHYEWIFTLTSISLFIKAGISFADGGRSLVNSLLSVLILNLYLIIFLRIQFRHAFTVALLANSFISTLWIDKYPLGIAMGHVLLLWLLTVLALYQNWRTEHRDRTLFEKRRQALIESEQRKIVSDQFQAVIEGRSTLLRKLHHDVSQPLTVLGMTLHSLKQATISDQHEDAQIGRSITMMEVAASDLHRLTEALDGLMSLSDFTPHRESISVNQVLEYMRTAYEGQAIKKGLQFRVRFAANDLCVWTDESAIRRMIGNLVSNAIKYTPPIKVDPVSGKQKACGVVIGAIQVAGGLVRFDVRDNGVGIPAEKKNEIYNEWVRIPNRDVKAQGLGLGLAIVRELRDKLGHHVQHYSVLGGGSRFSVSTPVADKRDVQAEKADSIAGIPIERLYVVIIEDDETVRNSLIDILRDSGYAIRENVRAVDGTAALTEIFDRMPDRAPNIVVTDYNLSTEETACDVIALVDERFSWATVPIIVFTGVKNPKLPERPHMSTLRKSPRAKRALLQMMQDSIINARESEETLDEDC